LFNNISATLQTTLVSDGYPAKEQFLYVEPTLNTDWRTEHRKYSRESA